MIVTETEAPSDTRRVGRTPKLPSYTYHPTFDAPRAAREYDGGQLLIDNPEYEARHMPDDATRDHSRRMHYAAHRLHAARSAAVVARWQAAYLGLRDRIVLGNRKLVYTAVRQRMAVSNRSDDLVGDCHIVLIQAVAGFNPWLSIRFSTYAYTCLVRALSRLYQRMTADRLAHALPLEALAHGEPSIGVPADPTASRSFPPLDLYFREDHPLLSVREKAILALRFRLAEAGGAEPTLERVGRDLGLSKERVRQVQATALDKLRRALTEFDRPSR